MVDGFVALSDNWSGQYSNQIIILMNTIRIALVAKKKYIFFALTPLFLKVIDINAMSRILDRSGPECMIQGIAWNTVHSRFLSNQEYDYVLNLGAEQWGEGCLVRPTHHLPAVFSPEEVTWGIYGSDDNQFAHFGYSNPILIPAKPILRDELNETLFEDDMVQQLRSVNGITTGSYTVFQYIAKMRYPKGNTINELGPMVPTTKIVHTLAMELLQSVNSSNVMCVHVRLSDLHSNDYYEYFQQHLSAFLHKHVPVGKLHIITDASEDMKLRMMDRFQTAVFECNNQEGCSEAPQAVLQQACAYANHFIGSEGSTFTGMIARLRTRSGKHAGFYVDSSTHELKPAHNMITIWNLPLTCDPPFCSDSR